MSDDARAKARITWAGIAVNLPLALVKIAVGWVTGSQALIADGAHSLADLVSDAAVLWALAHSAQEPDEEHPWGHGRFETLATLAVSALLGLTALGIAWEALTRLGQPVAAPGLPALWVAAGSILLKEALFHATMQVGRRTGSALIRANAWHHRSDAMSSVVALAGIGGALAGWSWADPAAAALIALMLGRIAWKQGRVAVNELVDTRAPQAERDRLETILTAAPGVRGFRDLRLRAHGGAVLADVSILVDPAITVTEGHRIAEAARATAMTDHPELVDLIIHVEPDGHHSGFGAETAPLRPEIETAITRCALSLPGVRAVDHLRLGYFDHGLDLELTADLAPGTDPALLAERLRERLAGSMPYLSSVSVLASVR